MIEPFENIFRWILDNSPKSKYDFSQSGMPEIKLSDYGIELRMEEYEKIKFSIERKFQEKVAELYDLDPEEILPTTGGTEGIAVASIYLKKNSDGIDVPVPEYEPMFRVPEELGFSVRRFNPLVEHPRGGNFSMSTTIPNNPTGNMPEERNLKEFLDGNRMVYIDETFHEFTFPEKPRTLYSGNSNLITSTTLTKFYGTSPWRIGWMVASKEKIRKLREYRFLTTGNSARYSMYAAVHILDKREVIKKRVEKIVSENRKTLKETFTELGLGHTTPDRTTFSFVETENDSAAVASHMLEKNGILVTPGKYFGVKNGYRICITGEPSEFKKAIGKLKEYYESEKDGSFI